VSPWAQAGLTHPGAIGSRPWKISSTWWGSSRACHSDCRSRSAFGLGGAQTPSNRSRRPQGHALGLPLGAPERQGATYLNAAEECNERLVSVVIPYFLWR
jgi:hypothetical protein